MRVYPASRSRALCQQMVAALHDAGHEVTHDWAAGPARSYDETDHVIADVDLAAIDRCGVLLLWWEQGLRAAYTELGYALAQGKLVIIVGCSNLDDNVFLRLKRIHHVATLEEAVFLLDAWEEG